MPVIYRVFDLHIDQFLLNMVDTMNSCKYFAVFVIYVFFCIVVQM